jgi:hypothetical protein
MPMETLHCDPFQAERTGSAETAKCDQTRTSKPNATCHWGRYTRTRSKRTRCCNNQMQPDTHVKAKREQGIPKNQSFFLCVHARFLAQA